ncbi:MAG: ABC transporter ATP-binding protein, partial [Anaerolineae bacterium]|nr:ABC transporter ATP-binding protein [Anaerolineae bacterium]
MGDNGSGKTTFLHCLLGLLKPERGRVDVFGQHTERARISELAAQVGIVFQNPEHQLFAASVWEEVIFAPRNLGLLDDAVEAQARDLLDRCGLAGREGEHPYRLSFGQKRRLNLASVLSYGPPLVLLDEILIGQDPANADFLLTLLCQHVQAGGTVIMADHHPDVLRRCASRLLFFEAGRLIVDAPVAAGFGQLAALGKTTYLPRAGQETA